MADSADTTNPISRKCSVEECGERVRAKGLCKTHYQRQRIWGRLHLVRSAAPKGSTERWLKEHVDHDGPDCLFWPYARNEQGYGTATVGGYYSLAHRHMCILAHGEPPFPKAEAAHFCGGGADGCVNPKHIRWTTRAVNQQDKTLHGTHRIASKRLTEDEVRAIYADDRSLGDVARDYGCSSSHVSAIRRGKIWGWLTAQQPIAGKWVELSPQAVVAIYTDPRRPVVVAHEFGCSVWVVHGIRSGRHYANLTAGLQRLSLDGAHKLAREDVLTIYNSNIAATKLAERFGCSPELVYAIRNGRTWASVTGHKKRDAS